MTLYNSLYIDAIVYTLVCFSNFFSLSSNILFIEIFQIMFYSRKKSVTHLTQDEKQRFNSMHAILYFHDYKHILEDRSYDKKSLLVNQGQIMSISLTG